jgi:hypothetical protein
MARWRNGCIISKLFGPNRPRGALVPFDTPMLRMARVCDDERDGLIAILRDFANNGAAYVVPWTSLPLMTAMTRSDLALHKGISESRSTTPEQVRTVVSELALAGILGSEAKDRETGRVQTERTQLADIELVLILHLLSSCGADLAGLTAGSIRSGATETKAAIGAAATAVGVRRQDIHQRTSELAKLLLPVGLIGGEGAIQHGWLRILHNEIYAFGQGRASNSPETIPPDANAALAAIFKAATATVQLSGAVISMIDYAVLDISATIRRWNTEQSVLRQTIDQLSELLDEWLPLMQAIRDALKEPPDHLVARLNAIRALLPRTLASDRSVNKDLIAARTGSEAVSQALTSKLSPICKVFCTLRS